eukprot:GHVO01039536.1.p1 GENE.GHVO01039536.1~~GHVO01039536.1.p1  ORF type:complete len:332 (+),score=80.82 GHVO01039536.1:147-1142(+)
MQTVTYMDIHTSMHLYTGPESAEDDLSLLGRKEFRKTISRDVKYLTTRKLLTAYEPADVNDPTKTKNRDSTDTKAYVQKRQDGWKEIKIKLNNPNYFLHPLRLALRNLPHQTTTVQLRNILETILINEGKDVLLRNSKAILRGRPLAASNATDASQIIATHFALKTTKGKDDDATTTKKKNATPYMLKKLCRLGLKTVRVMKEKDMLTGKEKDSKGFAFVECAIFEISEFLKRRLDGSIKAFPKRPIIVEFAIDDARALAKQARRKKETTKKTEEPLKTRKYFVERETPVNSPKGDSKKIASPPIQKTKKLSRGQKQREKRRTQQVAKTDK